MKPEHKQAGLTKPQWELLCEIVDGERCRTAEFYKPRVNLEELGLIIANWSGSVRATVAGKELVAKVRSAASGMGGQGE